MPPRGWPPPEPCAQFIVTESRGFPGLLSLRPYPRVSDGPTLQEVLTTAGFKVGDVVELRIDHQTRIWRGEDTVIPPPGQLRKRKRDPNRKR